MRVITGSARGRRLVSPEGYDVRPTTDKVKESLFNIIQFNLPGSVVLDLFAGSGQLGIEALSRGAQKAVFVDSSRKSVEVIKKNIELCRFQNESQIHLCDSIAFLKSLREIYDIVLLDPPYHKNLCVDALEYLSAAVNEDSLVICETQSDEILPEETEGFVLDRCYVYSSIKLWLYRLKTGRGDD